MLRSSSTTYAATINIIKQGVESKEKVLGMSYTDSAEVLVVEFFKKLRGPDVPEVRASKQLRKGTKSIGMEKDECLCCD